MTQNYQPDERWISVYGIELLGCPSGMVPENVDTAQELKIVKVYGIGNGTEACSCQQVEPFYMLVWGKGQETDCCATPGSLETRMWIMKATAITAQLTATTGTAEEILKKNTGPHP